MIVYRITREIYFKDISGTGSRIYGGRWNFKGVATLYASETRALSTLELLVHTDYDLTPPKLKLVSIELPLQTEELKVVELKELPENWRKTPPPPQLKRIGEKYLIQENNLAIKVPSVLIPEEYNILVNPKHQDFKKVRIKKIETFKINLRLIK